MFAELFKQVQDQGEALWSISVEDTDEFKEDRLINYCNHFNLQIVDVVLQDVFLVYVIRLKK